MRRFNLKGTVVQRMKGIIREDPKPVESSVQDLQPVPGIKAEFLPEQGQLTAVWRTDVGRLRKSNQDAVILGNGLAGVADGMGGHRGGEIASSGLCEGLLRETKGCSPDRNTLEKAVKTVNLELWSKQEKDASLSGMGTTLTILWPARGEMIIGQVGDSRAYLIRDGILTQVTSDHSMVADMVRKGVLTEEQAACHPMRNYITRAVGTEENVEIDISLHGRKKNDRWLICSDGLYGMMSRELLHQLASTADLDEAADSLMQAALDGGGKDNISLVLLQDHTETPDDDSAVPEGAAESIKAEEKDSSVHSEEVSPQ